MSPSLKIYADYNATTPMRPNAIDVLSALSALPFNASSIHAFGRQAKMHLDRTRHAFAGYFQCPPEQLFFTSSATEANNMVVRSFPGATIASAVEHDSIRQIPGVVTTPVLENGLIDLDGLDRTLADLKAPALVAIQLANNETGILQPIAQVCTIVHKYGGYVLCDASQGLGRLNINTKTLGVDYMTASAHKFGGPKGVGILAQINGKAPLTSLIYGGGQERGLRAGTENIPAIAASWIALEEALADDQAQIMALRRQLESSLVQAGIIIGASLPRLPNTCCIAMPPVPADEQVIHFDMAGIAISSGAACSSGKVKPSHVLQAMGLAPEIVGSAIRISLGWQTTSENITTISEKWLQIFREWRNNNPQHITTDN